LTEAIKIPFIIPSRNTVDQMHWTEKRKHRQEYELFIRSEMTKRKIKKAEPGQVFKLKIHTMRKRLIRDHTNLVGGAKQMEDALSNELFIWDDDIKYIGIPEIKQFKSKVEFTLIEREG